MRHLVRIAKQKCYTIAALARLGATIEGVFMHRTFTAVLLGLTSLMCTAVHAEQKVETAGFAMSGPGSLGLLSDVGGTARIAVKPNDGIEGIDYDITSSDAYGSSSDNWGQSEFAFDVHDGYRITSMTLTGTLTGVLAPYVPPEGGENSPETGRIGGKASNEFSMGWSFGQGGQPISGGQQTVKNVNGNQQLQLNANVPFEGDFTMALNSQIYVEAASGYYYWYDHGEAEVIVFYDSYASAHWHDVVLTVEVSPVPEPATYAMLLGGLGVAGFAARRRKI